MSLNLGLRAHDFGTCDADLLAAKIAKSGAKCVQLALSKALPGEPMLPSDLGETGIKSVAEAFHSRNLQIAVLGCYIDMVTPDLSAREVALQRHEAHLDIADHFACGIVGTETGSPLPYLEKSANGREEAFRVALSSLLRLIRKAEEVPGVIVGVEAVADHHALSSAEHMRQLIDTAASDSLGVIFDPVNLVPKQGVANMDDFLDDCFEKFGKHIVAVHAKDYHMVKEGDVQRKVDPMPAGHGELDWQGVLRRLKDYGKADVPILLEETGPGLAENAFDYLRKSAAVSE